MKKLSIALINLPLLALGTALAQTATQWIMMTC